MRTLIYLGGWLISVSASLYLWQLSLAWGLDLFTEAGSGGSAISGLIGLILMLGCMIIGLALTGILVAIYGNFANRYGVSTFKQGTIEERKSSLSALLLLVALGSCAGLPAELHKDPSFGFVYAPLQGADVRWPN